MACCDSFGWDGRGSGTPRTAVLSGTPAAGDQGHATKITITATNGVGEPATQTLAIKIT